MLQRTSEVLQLRWLPEAKDYGGLERWLEIHRLLPQHDTFIDMHIVRAIYPVGYNLMSTRRSVETELRAPRLLRQGDGSKGGTGETGSLCRLNETLGSDSSNPIPTCIGTYNIPDSDYIERIYTGSI